MYELLSAMLLILPIKIHSVGTSQVVQQLRTHLPMQGRQVQSLVGELGFHVTQGN